MTTYGQATTKLDQDWSEYDMRVAKCQMSSYGKVFLDEYGCPIDDEYELESLAERELVIRSA